MKIKCKDSASEKSQLLPKKLRSISHIINPFLHTSEDLAPFCGVSGAGHGWIRMLDLPLHPVKISTFLNEDYTPNSAAHSRGMSQDSFWISAVSMRRKRKLLAVVSMASPRGNHA